MSTTPSHTTRQTRPLLTAPDHPLTPLSAERDPRPCDGSSTTRTARGDSVRFVFVALDEPHKKTVQAFTAGRPDRTARPGAAARPCDRAGHRPGRVGHPASASSARRSIDARPTATSRSSTRSSRTSSPSCSSARTGSTRCASATSTRPRCAQFRCRPACSATRTRSGRRIVRVLAFYQYDEADLPWAHPIDGVVAYVDLTAAHGREGHRRDRAGRCRPSAVSGTPRRTRLRRAPISSRSRSPNPKAPASPSTATEITWADWSFRFGFDVARGPDAAPAVVRDGDVERPVIYRASIAEMVVPYADPSPVRYWQNYFDQGEYLFGRYTNSLELGCDCLGEIKYFDVDDRRRARPPQGHEERDLPARGGLRRAVEAHRHVQRDGRDPALTATRHLLLLDHRQLRLRVLLVPLPRRHHRARGQGHRHRLHLRLPRTPTASPARWHRDSAPRSISTCSRPAWTWPSTATSTSVEEVDAVAVPMGPDNPWGNAFRPQKTKLTTRVGGRCAPPTTSRRGSGTSPTPPSRTGWVRTSATRCTPKGSRSCWPIRPARSPSGPRSPPSTCGSPSTTRRSVIRPATS